MNEIERKKIDRIISETIPVNLSKDLRRQVQEVAHQYFLQRKDELCNKIEEISFSDQFNDVFKTTMKMRSDIQRVLRMMQ